MAVTVVDSDVLIDALNGREPGATRVAEGLEARSLATTALSVFELLSGARSEAQRQKIATLLAALAVLPFDQSAARAAASVRTELETSGRAIGMADYLIAGICLSHSAALLTRNRKHFERVRSLRLADL